MKKASQDFLLTISHITRYDFSEPVYLEPHFLFFLPAATSYYALKEHRLEIDPEPRGIFSHHGPEGQLGSLVWFNSTHRHFQIKAETVLQIFPYNPFDFLIFPIEFARFPIQYPKIIDEILDSGIQKKMIASEIKKYAATLLENIPYESGEQRDTVTVLTEVTRLLHRDFTLVERPFGPPQSALTTFNNQKGSCRDLAQFQITLLRYWGLAARFVSGYLYLEAPDHKPHFELHAWVEVYLPGPGWIGLDPSHGVFTDRHYIPVSRSQQHSQTLPVVGSYRGEAKAKLKTKLNMVKE